MEMTIQESTKPEAFFLRRLVQIREELRAEKQRLETEAEAEFQKALVRTLKSAGVTIARDCLISSEYGALVVKRGGLKAELRIDTKVERDGAYAKRDECIRKNRVVCKMNTNGAAKAFGSYVRMLYGPKATIEQMQAALDQKIDDALCGC